MQTLCFDLAITHPYTAQLEMTRSLRGHVKKELHAGKCTSMSKSKSKSVEGGGFRGGSFRGGAITLYTSDTSGGGFMWSGALDS